jgi:hypothetical protein
LLSSIVEAPTVDVDDIVMDVLFYCARYSLRVLVTALPLGCWIWIGLTFMILFEKVICVCVSERLKIRVEHENLIVKKFNVESELKSYM